MSTKNLEKALQLMGRLETTAFGSSQGRDEAFAAWQAAKVELEALKSALRPFAEFARRFDLKPIPNTERADVLYGIHAGEKDLEADVRLSHCHAALKALED